MIKLIFLGILSGAFFSTTFILNEVMSLDGGHWVWSASLRYLFMSLFLTLIILFQGGTARLKGVIALFFSHWRFWIIAGGIGFGGFYALICFSADRCPGWVIAATWQFTVVASLFVFMGFGNSFPKRVWFFSLIIFSDVVLVNLSQTQDIHFKGLIQGGLPVLLAAFCYPFGNQLVWEAANGSHKKVPQIKSRLLNNVFNKVWLMTLGSFPLWAVLVIVVSPPAPAISQWMNAGAVALFSGIFATGIFLFARTLASNANELAAVDATQSSEVVFALAGGLVFLGTQAPDRTAIIGLLMILSGLIFFIKYQKTKDKKP
ncbi:MAG: multidrug resistance efflux transporter family protein [Desulfobacter sp.]|nr:multidrug resistance efflux transporter family protein [Desulfobacter sp.]WDP85376.1 MAG: multidrug resistance efflux transporter family protein [Desulfobacter sp.]